ncbi:Peptide methionine sulfoxide reductase [Mycena venus]|uniref:peptide-methionine (S)-S-oxide reductase n=1 Tax=Mycena venus TaxID=2733690 RepID=A0A8H6XSQ7_9AGAR|nr:Peptide methionine sulfoxide reductase [Mycena venus]
MTSTPEIAIFASGCFWGTEHIFVKHFPLPRASSRRVSVCSGETQHAEAVRIEFDPKIVSYAELVEFFYRTHDPTTVNQQGGDVGTQYRSAIFTTTPEQAETAKRVTKEVQAKHFTPNGTKIVTAIDAAGPWWDAEAYHQLYLFNNPNGYQCSTHRLHW